MASFAIFSCADATVKWLSADYSVFQIIFFQALFNLLPLTWLIVREGGASALRPRHPRLVALRSALMAIDMVLVFFAFATLPLADAYTMIFMVPMLVTALSVPLLGEKVGWRRWSATIVGFAGVLIVLRPGFAEVNWGHVAALASAFFFALSLIVVRRIGNDETSSCLFFSMLIGFVAVSGPVLPFLFVMPTMQDLALLVGLGLISGVGHITLIQAFRLAPSAVVSPFQYSQIVWGVLFGLWLFGDRPDGWVVAGSAVIIASGLYILWRETVRRRQAPLT